MSAPMPSHRACRRSAAGADSFLRASNCLARIIGVGRDDHLGKDRGDLLRRSRSSVRFTATMPPNGETGSHKNALSQASASVAAVATPQGLACLMIATVGAVEFRDAFECGVGVVQVVVGEFLALHLRCRRDARPLAGGIECRRLVRVLAIAQRLPQRAGDA